MCCVALVLNDPPQACLHSSLLTKSVLAPEGVLGAPGSWGSCAQGARHRLGPRAPSPPSSEGCPEPCVCAAWSGCDPQELETGSLGLLRSGVTFLLGPQPVNLPLSRGWARIHRQQSLGLGRRSLSTPAAPGLLPFCTKLLLGLHVTEVMEKGKFTPDGSRFSSLESRARSGPTCFEREIQCLLMSFLQGELGMLERAEPGLSLF